MIGTSGQLSAPPDPQQAHGGARGEQRGAARAAARHARRRGRRRPICAFSPRCRCALEPAGRGGRGTCWRRGCGRARAARLVLLQARKLAQLRGCGLARAFAPARAAASVQSGARGRALTPRVPRSDPLAAYQGAHAPVARPALPQPLPPPAPGAPLPHPAGGMPPPGGPWLPPPHHGAGGAHPQQPHFAPHAQQHCQQFAQPEQWPPTSFVGGGRAGRAAGRGQGGGNAGGHNGRGGGGGNGGGGGCVPCLSVFATLTRALTRIFGAKAACEDASWPRRASGG